MIVRPFCCLLILLAILAPVAYAQEGSPTPRTSGPVYLTESVPTGTASSQLLSLGLKDVVDRAVRANLAAVLGSEEQKVAAAQRLQDLAELFPRVDAYIASEQRQTNLAAFGFSGFPGVSKVVGPFALIDARATLSMPLVDLERRHNLRESSASERASEWTNANTRELVVLTVVDFYFQIVSSESRVTAVEAQLDRSPIRQA